MNAPRSGGAPPALGKVALGGAWTTSIGVALQIGGQMLALVLLARLLGPEAFGISAAVNLCVVFSRMVPQTLFGVPVLQLPVLDRRHLGSALIGGLATGLACAAVLVAFAPAIAGAIGVPEAAAGLAVLAVVFLWDAGGMVSERVLSRDFRFSVVVMTEAFATFLCTGALAVALAWNGFGYWSLIYAAVAHSALRSTVLMIAARRRLSLAADLAAMRDLLRVGTGAAAGAFINFFAVQGDNLLVARFLGPAALGFYERAYRIASVPLTHYDRALSNVAFASIARVQDDPARLRRAFRRGLALTVLFGAPMTTTLAVLGPEIVLVLFGPGWGASVLPYQILACALALRLAYRVCMLVILACGQTWAYSAVQLVFAGCVLGGAALAAPHGLPAVAAAVAAAQLVNLAILGGLAMRRTGVRPLEFLALWAPGIGHAALLALALAPLRVAMAPLGLPLLTLGAAGCVVALWAGLLAATPWRVLWGEDGLWLRGEIRATLLRRLRRRGGGAAPPAAG